jgi:two-component system, NarL family, nitrate/nitrite response regulator NarP
MNTTETATQIRVGVVEPDPLVREGLCLSLNTHVGIRVLECVASVEALIATPGTLDAVLFACRYPSDIFGEGLTLDYWRLRLPDIRIIVLTQTRARAPIATLIDAGIDGYAVRNAAAGAELARIVRGEQRLCALASEIFANSASEANLTNREIQVARVLQMAKAKSRKTLAALLNIRYHTLNVHIRNIALKLDVTNEVMLIKRCVELGVLADEA